MGVAILGCPILGSGICSPCRYTLTVISTNSPPYLLRTLMLYLPESSGVTLLMTRLANFPPSNVILVCSVEATSCSFLNQVTSGVGSPHTVQVRLRDCRGSESQRARISSEVPLTNIYPKNKVSQTLTNLQQATAVSLCWQSEKISEHSKSTRELTRLLLS